MRVEPYLSFEGRCEEAIEFYKKAVGAQVQMMLRFEEAPRGQGPMGAEEISRKIMHASLRIGESTVLVSDGRCMSASNFHGTSLSLTVATDAEAEKLFAALSEGGNVRMPMAKTFFASRFGMVNDRFGVPWLVLVGQQ